MMKLSQMINRRIGEHMKHVGDCNEAGCPLELTQIVTEVRELEEKLEGLEQNLAFVNALADQRGVQNTREYIGSIPVLGEVS